MTLDPELDVNIMDDDHLKAPDGVMVGKLIRDFRIRKCQEMTGLNYGKLNAMKFTDAADEYENAAARESSLIQT
ncbi:hypothetical protein BBO99_00000232 [Phytophthora kernoviae]|uniref:Uncharacterized protein n=2 Tax=Phytophthora kernoviae TaxID=325452 RepID=A0A3R7GN97_9STRA|nr:hypothetical protein G195_002393 [Phytophthora kernoviae 00238/432]KAG2530671.1 hypothetical protein JM16_001494 [Phytophthora kernoviae]KAG2530889.1 hypothetical protein JM18_001336 [Phytophthora kernoviae]RLN21336.1 hypothetical protein BBI17_000358 [Phytophthora kernoviae]RLN85728.1 hypothetical protein BBO99_00000232 [Phytophthora kernoviae]